MIHLFLQRLSVVLFSFMMVAAQAAPPRQAVITCKVYNSTGSGIFLYKVENGEALSLGFRRPAGNDDTCVFSVSLDKEAVFFLRKAGPHLTEFTHVIYLKPGDTKSVAYYCDKISSSDSFVVREPSKETTCLQNWANRLSAVYKLGSTRTSREDFFAAYNQLVKNAPALKEKAVPANPYFHHMFVSKVNADIEFIKTAAFFYNNERMIGGYDSIGEHKKFYQSLATQRFCKEDLLQSEHGIELVKFTHGFQMFHQLGTAEKMKEAIMSGASFVEKAKSICNDKVRAAYVYDRMQQVNNYETFKRDVQPFKNLFNTSDYKMAYQKKEDALTVYAKGAVAYNFSLPDTKDTLVSLSDFKGKVVVLDVWAMWCAPCLAEKPFFSKVEEEYEGRDDIVFVGISHDGAAKKNAWKQFVEKKGWKSVELLSDFDKSIGKYYKIDGIPRFMIFDKEGKIVTVDAPRPSNPEFKKLIEQTLNSTGRANP